MAQALVSSTYFNDMKNAKSASIPQIKLDTLSRINVVGTSGVGKSTFGNQLAKVLAIPFIEMDALYWLPNWSEPTDEDFFPILEEKLRGDTWVLDGNYSRTTAIKWHRVQTVIWLDYSFIRTLFQAVLRAIDRIWTQGELWPNTGNRESFRVSFLSRDSVILWMITSFRRRKDKYSALIKNGKYSGIFFVHLRSPQQSQAFLAHLKVMVEKG